MLKSVSFLRVCTIIMGLVMAHSPVDPGRGFILVPPSSKIRRLLIINSTVVAGKEMTLIETLDLSDDLPLRMKEEQRLELYE